MNLQKLGILSAETISELKNKKLALVIRGDMVFVDEDDFLEAKRITKKHEGRVSISEKIHRINGYTFKTPPELKISSINAAGSSCVPNSQQKNNVTINRFSKPSNGLNSDQRLKKLRNVTLHGKSIQLDVATLSPSYSGIIISDDNGIPLYEVIPSNVFILFNSDLNTKASKEIHEFILMFAITLANHNNDEIVSMYRKIWEQQAPDREKLEIKQFEEICSGGIKKEINSLKGRIRENEVTVSSLQKKLYISLENLNKQKMLLESHEIVMSKGIAEKAKEEWEKLRNLEKRNVAYNIRVTQNEFSFTTKPIYWTPKKRMSFLDPATQSKSVEISEPVELGQYEISVKMISHERSTADLVKIQNITRKISYQANKWEHPHVKQGNVCYGNMTVAIPKFAVERNFEAIIMCMIKWLENVDTGDAWGKNIYHWIVDHQKRNKKPGKKKAVKNNTPQNESQVPERI